MRVTLFTTAALVAAITSMTSPRVASALTPDEIACEDAVLGSAQDFVSDKLKALVDCNNKGNCNTDKRDRQITKATARLTRALSRICRGVTLENLGFPGSCPTSGGSFTTDDLGSCLATELESFVDAAIALAYPNGGADLTGDDAQCQGTIGGESRLFINRKMRARTRCLDLQLKGKLSDTVNCLAEVPPGTGNRDTDQLIQKAFKQFGDKLRRGCHGADLSAIGFPGSCPASEGFSLNDLQSCLETSLETALDQAVLLLVPFTSPVATATPTPEETPSAVATPEETASAGPTEEATPTETASPGPGEPTPTETASPGPGEPTATPTIIIIEPSPTETAAPGSTPTETATVAAQPTPTASEGLATATEAAPTATEAGPTPSAGVPTATEAAPTATESPTPAETASPGPEPTSTPGGSLCGNGVLDAGEDCDLSAGASGTCAAASNTSADFTCDNCTCACPAFVKFTGTSTTGILDTGWTGNGHDATVVSDGTVTVGVASCAGASRPCGVCSLVGPVENLNPAVYPSSPGPSKEIEDHRCSNNTSVVCTDNTPCSQQCVGGTNDGNACTAASACPGGACPAAGTCEFQFGTYLPLAAGGVSTCVGNQINGSITGTADIESGASATSAKLTSRVYNGITLSNPCPQCNGDTTTNDGAREGTCSGGARDGKSCDVNGKSPNISFGSTSLDCPPVGGALIATLGIDLSNTTGTKVRTLSADNPLCTAGGWTTFRCQCDTCANTAATACATNADCPAGVACGVKRCINGTNAGAQCVGATECPGGACSKPGLATAPNQCDGGPGSGDCVADAGTPSPNDRICSSGPLESFCGPVETFRGCAVDGDCPFAGDTCTVQRFRDCFDNGVTGETLTATGVQSPPVNDVSNPTLAALFCVGPTSSASVNSAAGLPGAGRLELGGTAAGLP